MTLHEGMTSGVACNLNSRGYHVLCKATENVVGHVKPYSITGTLPLIKDLQVPFSLSLSHIHYSLLALNSVTLSPLSVLQDEGFDVQTTGYGEDFSFLTAETHYLCA